MKLKSVLTLSFVVFLWGSSFTLLKLGLEEIPPITLAFLRFLVALPLLIVFTYSRDINAFRRHVLKDWKIFSVLGLTGVTLYHLFQNLGLQLTTASNSSLIISANPVFIALLDHIYLRERMSLKRASGMILAFLGVILVIGPTEARWSLNPMGVTGDLLSLGAAISWAFYSVLSRKTLSNYNPEKITVFSMVYGTLFLFPAAFALEKPILPASAWLWLLLLILSLLCSGLAYLLWIRALKDVPTTKAGVFLFFLPIVSVSMAHLVLSEFWGINFVVGALLVILGVAITERG